MVADEARDSWFRRFSCAVAERVGTHWAFVIALGVVGAWAITGPMFGYSDSWQLVINTGTTIVTFLMVFLIQATQNRDGKAIQLKLDELIRATQGAHNALLDLEEIDDEQFESYRRSYERLAAAAREKLEKGELDTDSPEIKDLGR
jgi:low affinity Fe/Cu permease